MKPIPPPQPAPDDDNDDAMVGTLLSRRRALALLGASSGVLAAGGVLATPAPGTRAASSALPTCVVRPALAEGPFFVDDRLRRSDLRPDPANGTVSAGIPLELSFRVTQVGAGACSPLEGVWVDVWHCDALGRYSGVGSEGTAGQQFLRGQQTTDARGLARFTTVYPGWYPGRAVHIHFKLRTVSSGQVRSEFASQLFFDEKVSEAVFAQAPYRQRGSRGRTLNAQDGIYRSGGSQLLLSLSRKGTGYAAVFDVGMNLR